MRFLFTCIFLSALLPQTLWARGDVFALVIGIDKYVNVSELKGAVNDANDMAESFEFIGAKKVVKLTDGQATRERIISHWLELTKAAGEGDYLFFYYAGHGSKHEAINPTLEDDGFDELFLLAGYDNRGEGTRERLMDDELAYLFDQEAEAEVILVADSCYSGSMERGTDLRASQEIRRNNQLGISPAEDRLRAHLEELANRPERSHPRLTKIFASSERTVVPEIAIGQQVRGAFTYHLARALRSAGDINGDGRLGLDEIRQSVFPSVQKATDGKQSPEVSRDNELASQVSFPLGIERDETEEKEDFVLGVAYVGRPLSGFVLPEGFLFVEHNSRANLIIDFDKKQLVTTTQDVVADFSSASSFNPKQLVGALHKWRLIAQLDQIQTDGAPQITLTDGNRIYYEGQPVEFSLLSPLYSNIILFNLAFDGTIQFMAPSVPEEPGLAGGRIVPESSNYLPSEAIPPFGADHLIVVVSPQPMMGLVSRLEELDGTRRADLLFDEWETYTKGEIYAISRQGLYTQAHQ